MAACFVQIPKLIVRIRFLSPHSMVLPQLARKQAVDHAVPSCSLEGHVGTKKALTDKPAVLGDPLRGLIVGTASQLQPGQSQLGECPPSEQADRMSRNTPAASLGGEPVAERRAALIKANVIQRAAAEHRGLVAWLDQREISSSPRKRASSCSAKALRASASVYGVVRHENRCITGSLNASSLPGTSASYQGRNNTTSSASGGTGNQSSAMPK